jgi:hypothetical protein
MSENIPPQQQLYPDEHHDATRMYHPLSGDSGPMVCSILQTINNVV